MRTCTAETLSNFVQVMPEAPFSEDGIVFTFAKKSEMTNRALELCAQHCPERIFTESQLNQLGESIAANALIGREKSVVLIRIDSKIGKKDFRRIIAHELMHIFCAKLEMDGEHFIDIYGTGTTPDVDLEDKTYDGVIVAGYDVWTEFIAQYYALSIIDGKSSEFADVSDYITHLFHDVHVFDIDRSKGSFSMLCAYWFSCMDFEETLDILNKPGTFLPTNEPHGEETQKALFDCVDYLHHQILNEKPWKITEDFIYGLGFRFSVFRIKNSQYLGKIGIM